MFLFLPLYLYATYNWRKVYVILQFCAIRWRH
uniref:Uncharacterized protein n=1 Tax=Arundo donax TaxID=35708 RepID=A0A0A9FMD7_ARUDO